jgi:hypothetical protein
MTRESIVYSIDVSDIQQVAEEDVERHLSAKEVQLVASRIGDYLDWSQAISLAIHDMEQKKLGKALATKANMAGRTKASATIPKSALTMRRGKASAKRTTKKTQ